MFVSEGLGKIRSDVVGADGVVLLIHGKIASVFESLEPEQNLFDSYNYSLVALRPSDLDDREKVRQKLSDALKAVVSGDFDPIFRKAARVLGPDGHTPESIRLAAAQILAQHLGSPAELDEVILKFKAAVKEAHHLGVSPSDDGKLNALRSYLESDRSPLTASLDRYLAAERVPFIIYGQGDGFLQKSRRGGSSLRRPSDASAFVVVGGFQENDVKARGQAGFTLSHLITDEFVTGKMKLSSNTELEHLPGVDFQKMKYQLGRKRKEIGPHNRNARLPVRMFPDEKTVAFVRANSPDTSARATANELHDPACNLGEAHHLLTHYTDEADRRMIRDRFDHVVAFHDAAMTHLDRKIEAHLHESRLPPLQLAALHASQAADPPPADRTPLTAEAAVARADRFARERLPAQYRLRVLLQPTPTHPIVLKLTNDEGHTAETVITTFEPDADRALDIKRRVQAHLLDIAGIAPYRGPMREGSYHVEQDEFIRAEPPRTTLAAKYGEHRLNMAWQRPREEMGLSLGLASSPANREEAEGRAEFVREQLEQARRDHPEHRFLPITRHDLSETLKAHVQSLGRPWHERMQAPIDQFPAALRFPFPGAGGDQKSWLHVDPLKTDGDPNYTWVLPIHIVVDGHRLSNASAQVNLHVRDRHTAERRAIETVNRMMEQVRDLPRAARWAVDPEHPDRLQSLSEAARDAAPHLLDTNRLTDIHNELRFPHKRELAVRLARPPTAENGMLSFTLGLFRGGDGDLSDPVHEKPGVDARPRLAERQFTIPASKADDIGRFREQVDRTFRSVIEEEYNPRSALNYDRERMGKLKPLRPFQPQFAPRMMNDAIRSHLGEFPDIVSESPMVARPRVRKPRPAAADPENPGFADKINENGTGRGGPG